MKQQKQQTQRARVRVLAAEQERSSQLFSYLGILVGVCGLIIAMVFWMAGVAAAQDDSTAAAGSGIVTVESTQDVASTADALTAALEGAGLTVFATIDHADNASGADLELPPTLLILAGNPNLGTPLMQASRTMAIDLPQKFLIWEEDGQVYVSYNDAGYLAERHGITGEEVTIGQITSALNRFATAAAGTEAAMNDTSSISDTASITNTMAMTTSVDITGDIGTSGPTDIGAAEITGEEAMTGTETMTGTGSTATTGDMTSALSSAVLIQFGENSISSAEFDQAFVQAMRNFANQQGIPLNETTVFFFADLRDRYLEQFVTEEVLLAEAVARGIEISDDEATDLIQPLKSNFVDDAAYQAALEAAGFASERDLIDAVKDDATINALLESIQADIAVSDEEIRTFYEENTDIFQIDPGVILPLEQVDERIQDLLFQQQLQDQIAEIRTDQGVEIFAGNLTPFDELLMNELGISSDISSSSTMTDTETMTSTDAVTATDVIAPDEIPPIPITSTDTITDVQPLSETTDITATDHVSASFVSPIPDAETDETQTGQMDQSGSPAAIVVSNQRITDGRVVIDEVTSPAGGWVVIHNNAGGYAGDSVIGPPIGHASVSVGTTQEVTIEIDMDEATGTLYAMLYPDRGTVGTFDDNDMEEGIMVDGASVQEVFTVTDMSLDDD